MTRFADVRNWRPGPLIEAEEHLRACSRTLLGLSDDLTQASNPRAWHGRAADAASAQRDLIADGVEHVVASVEALRPRLAGAAAGVRDLSEMVSAADELARANGFAIDDAGKVVDGGQGSPLPPDKYRVVTAVGGLALALLTALEREKTRIRLNSQVRQILARAQAIDAALAEVVGKISRGEISDGGARTLAGAARAGSALGGPELPIPGRPPNPLSDRGAGKHGSDPWYTTADDRVVKGLAVDAATVAGLIGGKHSAALLRHYLDNSGDDFRVSLEEMMREVPRFRRAVERTMAHKVAKIAAAAARDGTYGEPVRFSTDWRGAYLHRTDNIDWYYAIGGLTYSVTGVATVRRPGRDGAPPDVDVHFRTHVYKRYNWDAGKSVDFGPVHISHARLADLHRAGVAREFDVVGSSEVKHFSGSVRAVGTQP